MPARYHGNKVYIKVHPKVADMLLEEENQHVEMLQKETGKTVHHHPRSGYPHQPV